MRTAYFDCFSGASGDMIVGALLDAGLSLDTLRAELEKLKLSGWEITLGRRVRAGISAADFDVQTEEDAPERGFTEIKALIEAGDLSPRIKERSIAVFRRLGEAEAKVHNTTLEKIHFHEVGAIDCIIDICGACIGLDMLGVERIVASPLPQGYGFVRCAHGRMPIPTPATIEILRGCPTYSVDVEGELVTPTGAAILATLADEWGRLPSLTPEVIGYGSGKKDFGPRPNLLRIILGETESTGRAGDRPPTEVRVIEANLDDMNPEGYDWVVQRLFDAGALDVTLTPIQMKKGRPGVTLSVIAAPEKEESLVDLLFRETTTFGVRTSPWQRHVLDREFRTVSTPYGDVKVKIGRRNAETVTASPEYEECRRLAEAAGAPLKDVYRAALAAIELMEKSVG
ncbi:MAG: nickel pincer cofactor biosynthesis protein LarC [Armatimonadetes bacterium]|nr:nickel pincer cofactor biosynthesis protein LarC [Armatimonadota bacterium]